jgi:hypothetical protein
MSSSQIAQKVIVYTLFVALCLTACLPSSTDPHSGTGGETSRPDASGGGGWIDWDGQGGWTSSDRRAMPEAGEEVVVEEELAAPPAVAAADEAPAEAGASKGAPMPAPTMVAAPTMAANQSQSPLRAGEVDDNAEWDDYLLYRLAYAGPPVHDRDVSERYIITVNDRDKNPLLDADVTVYAGNEPVFSGHTYASGQVLFFPKALGVSDEVDSFQVVAEKDDARGEAMLVRGETCQLALNLAHAGREQDEPVNLDVLFLIDSTGSMADEIDKLQESIREIAAHIDRLPGQPRARFAMTIYRDRGDLFVSRTFDFTPDVGAFHEALAEVEAEGGGDYPESLNEALHRAIHAPEWRGQNAVQLIFLVADAPPHLDYPQDYDYAVGMENAAERGIKIFPIASSGLDDQGEYIFRQIAQFTQGRFVFLTYEGPTNGGAPGDETTHHVEDYSVENLDDLLVRLVEEELAYQNPGLTRAQ